MTLMVQYGCKFTLVALKLLMAWLIYLGMCPKERVLAFLSSSGVAGCYEKESYPQDVEKRG